MVYYTLSSGERLRDLTIGVSYKTISCANSFCLQIPAPTGDRLRDLTLSPLGITISVRLPQDAELSSTGNAIQSPHGPVKYTTEY